MQRNNYKGENRNKTSGLDRNVPTSPGQSNSQIPFGGNLLLSHNKTRFQDGGISRKPEPEAPAGALDFSPHAPGRTPPQNSARLPEETKHLVYAGSLQRLTDVGRPPRPGLTHCACAAPGARRPTGHKSRLPSVRPGYHGDTTTKF